jgi:hypothetical protein
LPLVKGVGGHQATALLQGLAEGGLAGGFLGTGVEGGVAQLGVLGPEGTLLANSCQFPGFQELLFCDIAQGWNTATIQRPRRWCVLMRLRIAWLMVLVTLTASSVTYSQAASGAAAQPLTIPFEPYNHLIFIDVRVNGSAPQGFLLDSGASTSF